MKNIVSRLVVAAGMGLCLGITTGASACEREFGSSYYRLTPLQGDGLSRAERSKCARGTLTAYSEQTGWVNMVDPTGQQIIAEDFMGIQVGDWDFMVVIGPGNEVVMRWGDFAGGQFFANGNNHSTFMALDDRGQELSAIRVGELLLQEDGRVFVGLYTNSHEYCETSSDAALNFNWQWSCYAPH